LLPWNFFSGAVGAGTGSLLNSRELLAKVYFPRLLIPFSQVLSSLVDFGISFLILLGLLAYYGIRPTWTIALIPIFLALAAMLGLGVGLGFAGVIVKYRDFSQFVAYLVRGWMYATPVVYAISVIPPEWQPLYYLNPLTGVIQGFRWAILGTPVPPAWSLVVSTLVVLVIFIGALYIFKRAERNIVDVA
jgi:lipopolysaccharide transport system permease protein